MIKKKILCIFAFLLIFNLVYGALFESFDSNANWTTTGTIDGNVFIQSVIAIKGTALELRTDGGNTSTLLKVLSKNTTTDTNVGFWFRSTSVAVADASDFDVSDLQVQVASDSKLNLIGLPSDPTIMEDVNANQWYFLILERIDLTHINAWAWDINGVIAGELANGIASNSWESTADFEFRTKNSEVASHSLFIDEVYTGITGFMPPSFGTDINAFFSDFNTYDGNNYAAYFDYDISYNCPVVNDPGDINLLIDDVNTAHFSLTCDGLPHDINGLYTPSGDGIRSVKLYLAPDANTFYDVNIYFDVNAPIATFDFNSSDYGFRSGTDVNVFVVCNDAVSPLTFYSFTVNDVNLINGWFDNNSAQEKIINPVVGNNVFSALCSDLAGNTSVDTNNFVTLYTGNFILINEETGAVFDLDDINGLIVYTPDSNFYYDMKTNSATSVTYMNTNDDTIRFELTYNDGTTIDLIVRSFTLTVLDLNSIRVCVPPYYPVFYTHFLLSSRQRKVAVHNPYANCYITGDYTRYAYQTAFINQVSLIEKQYNLYAWDSNNQRIVLGLIDGSVESTLNIDALILALTEYEVIVAGEALYISKAYDNTLLFAYKNVKANNAQLKLELYDGALLVWNYTENDTPNDFRVYWDHTTTDINASMLKLSVTRTLIDGSVETYDRYITLEGVDVTGSLPSEFAIIIAFVIVIFSLTFVAYKFAMGWFGIIACMIGIAILTMATPIWYIVFGQAILIIVIVFISLIYRSETVAVT